MTGPDQVDAVRIIRKRGEHNVSRKHMDPDALKVLYRLMRNGFTAYLVGGGVRDLLLGRQPKDFDISTDAHPRHIRKLFRNSFLIGRRFKLVHVRFGENVIEVSTFRRRPEASAPVEGEGSATGDEPESLYQESDNTFGTPEEDAWRRDFTINALFYDIRTYSIIDHVGGLQDLEDRLIRCIGNPDERFQEDPVRMIRAVRFASRLDFRIETETYQAIGRHQSQLALAAPPRLLEEIYKLFPYAAAEPAFRLLRRTGLLAALFPELNAFLDRSGHETALFWKHLMGLDRREHEGASVADSALIFATLFYAPFLEALRAGQRQHDVARHALTARTLLDPVAERFRMPKRVFFRTILILDAQRRFEAEGRRFSRRRFVAHEAFADMLALRRIHLLALGQDPAELDAWAALHEEVMRSRPAPRERSERGPRRRRRRRSEAGFDGDGAGREAPPADEAEPVP